MSATAVIARGKPERADQRSRAEGDAVMNLVHQLVDKIHPRDSRWLEDDDVLLDVSVNGVRCLLVRTRSMVEGISSIPLSPREIEISRMVAKGLPNKTIAAVLDISTWTVGTHMRRVFAKLGVGSRAAMVARLAEYGIIENRTTPKVPPASVTA